MVKCKICDKSIRSDHVKRHSHTHKELYALDVNDMREEIKERKRQYENREERKRSVREIAQQEGTSLECIGEQTSLAALDIETLEVEMFKDNQKYLENIELGKQVDNIIDKGVIREESLIKERKYALDLYRKLRSCFDITTVQLRQWQQDAMKYFESPTTRQVIWIRGNNGNEGKSWFQNYVQTFYGYHRVCRLDLRIKHANVCNVLKKRTLGTIDIFLFNDSRSVSGEDVNMYRILEDVKDGQATTSKYDNDNIRFKTPNTVMVFSNHLPDLKKLSKDRWVLLLVNKDGLEDVLELHAKNSNKTKQRVKSNFWPKVSL